MSPVSGRSKLIWAVLALVAMACFIAAWPIYKMYSVKPVSASLMERTKQAVEKNPQLKPDWDKAMEDGATLFNCGLQAAKAAKAAPVKRHVEWYLSKEHLANIEQGCPLTAYAGDVRRLGAEARQSYAHGLQWNIEQLASLIDNGDPQAKRQLAVALFSQLVGALVLSRAVAEADPALAEEILEAGRQQLLLALEK